MKNTLLTWMLIAAVASIGVTSLLHSKQIKDNRQMISNVVLISTYIAENLEL